MNRRNPWNSYRQVATQTASPGQLVLMLFDGAIGFLERASEGFQSSDVLERNQTFNNNLLKAQAIISELDCSLNLDEGGELAHTLRRLYHYFDRRLNESNMRKDDEGVREVIQRLTVLRAAWSQMLANTANDSPMDSAHPQLSVVG
jgi:flagellar protein FliS